MGREFWTQAGPGIPFPTARAESAGPAGFYELVFARGIFAKWQGSAGSPENVSLPLGQEGAS
jgi:hypothetical protein